MGCRKTVRHRNKDIIAFAECGSDGFSEENANKKMQPKKKKKKPTLHDTAIFYSLPQTMVKA